MDSRTSKIKYFIISLWVVLLFVSIYSYFFHGGFAQSQLLAIFGSSVLLGYAVYFVASCLRGFTLIPVTYFILAGIVFFPPWPLYVLTMVGVMFSSASVYYFSKFMHFDEYFEAKHKKQIQQIKSFIVKNELPVVIVWSFTPFLATDLICYVCGALEINVKKFLFGVVVGEGISCAIYIFLGKEILGFLHL